MKIALVANTAWNLRNFRWGLIRALQREGHTVLAVAPEDDFSAELAENDIQVYSLPMDGKTRNPFKDLLYLGRLYRLYRRLRPDVVLHFTIKPNIYGSLAAGRLKIPVINNITGLGNVFLQENLVSKIVRLLYKLSLSRARKTFFQNREDRRLFLDKKIVREDAIDVLPGSGIDTEIFTPLPAEGGEPGRTRFLLIARLIWEKGIREFVEAAAVLRSSGAEADFLLCGELGVSNPSAIPAAQVAAWEAEGLIRYLGFKRNIREVIREADCVVLPSYYREGVPRTLLESASMARPIITTDHIGCREVVDPGRNGFLCRIRDSRDLAAAMERFLALTPEERLRFGRAGREKVRAQFDERIIIRKYLDEIRRVEKDTPESDVATPGR